MSIGVPVRTLDSVKEKTADAGPSWKGKRKKISSASRARNATAKTSEFQTFQL